VQAARIPGTQGSIGGPSIDKQTHRRAASAAHRAVAPFPGDEKHLAVQADMTQAGKPRASADGPALTARKCSIDTESSHHCEAA
jgi:hypothetical protein